MSDVDRRRQEVRITIVVQQCWGDWTVRTTVTHVNVPTTPPLRLEMFVIATNTTSHRFPNLEGVRQATAGTRENLAAALGP